MLESPEAHTPDNGTACEIATSVALGNQQERQVLLARLAMVFDCEGYITLRTQQRSKTRPMDITPVVCMNNVDRTFIEWVAAALEALEVGHWVYWLKPTGYGKRQIAKVTVEGVQRVGKLLPLLRPYLIVKAKQADLVLEFVAARQQAWMGDSRRRAYSDREVDIANEIRHFAQKGKRWMPVSSTSKRDAADQLRTHMGRAS